MGYLGVVKKGEREKGAMNDVHVLYLACMYPDIK